MAFPFSVHFYKRLKAAVTPDNDLKILYYIKRLIVEDDADNVVVRDMQVAFKGSTSIWRGSLFGGVDSGVFNLIYKDDSWWLHYKIKMRKLFIGAAILSTIIGVYAWRNEDPWWAGIAAFILLCGVNWVINLIRHKRVAATLSAGIDELASDKQ